MSCCGKIGAVLKKILSKLKPILTVLLLAFAAYMLFFVAPGTMVTLFEGFSWLPAWATTATATASVWGYAALGLALVINPEGVSEVAGSIAGTIGSVAGSVISGAVGGAAAGLLSNPWFGLAAAVAVWFLFFRKGDDGETGYQTLRSQFSNDETSGRRGREPTTEEKDGV